MALLNTPSYTGKHLYLENFIEKALDLSQKNWSWTPSSATSCFWTLDTALSLQLTDHWLLQFANGMDE